MRCSVCPPSCSSRALSRLFSSATPTPGIYTLSLHDALPIFSLGDDCGWPYTAGNQPAVPGTRAPVRSEEHTSELQSRGHLVCRLLLEKKKRATGICFLRCSTAALRAHPSRLRDLDSTHSLVS